MVYMFRITNVVHVLGVGCWCYLFVHFVLFFGCFVVISLWFFPFSTLSKFIVDSDLNDKAVFIIKHLQVLLCIYIEHFNLRLKCFVYLY